MQNNIKQKLRNRMITSNLDSAMQLALEGPDKDYDNIIEEAIVLWKNSSKF